MTLYAIDFDGTCVEHRYPHLGPDVPGAVATLRDLVARGDRLILWTMRSGETLEAAVAWYAARSLPLFGVNANPEQHWSDSPKAYAHVYIDDAALGCPLVRPGATASGDAPRPYVDWPAVRRLLELGELDGSDVATPARRR